jgi:hypothetical protein
MEPKECFKSRFSYIDSRFKVNENEASNWNEYSNRGDELIDFLEDKEDVFNRFSGEKDLSTFLK